MLPQDTDVQRIQRSMLAAPRPEPIGKPDEVLLVDRLQNCRDRLLDDLCYRRCESVEKWRRRRVVFRFRYNTTL
jgi:hypothetical protein